MKYVRFKVEDVVKYGLLEDDVIVELDGDYLNGEPKRLEKTYSASEVQLLAPVNPGKIIVIGLNYKAHAEEMGREIPDEPMMFMVSPTAVIGHNTPVILPNLQNRIDYEAELAIVIGKKAKDVKRDDALSYIFGYTCANDISDRDLQKKDVQFTRAKSFDTFKPLGPVIATDIDPNNVEIKLFVDGELRQESNTNDFIHNVETLIEEITKVMALYPGDVILTGTPSGVGPLVPGNNVEVMIEGIGKLTNKVTE